MNLNIMLFILMGIIILIFIPIIIILIKIRAIIIRENEIIKKEDEYHSIININGIDVPVQTVSPKTLALKIELEQAYNTFDRFADEVLDYVDDRVIFLRLLMAAGYTAEQLIEDCWSDKEELIKFFGADILGGNK